MFPLFSSSSYKVEIQRTVQCFVAMDIPQASFDVWRPFCVYRIYGLTIFGAHWGNKNNVLFFLTNCQVAVFFHRAIMQHLELLGFSSLLKSTKLKSVQRGYFTSVGSMKHSHFFFYLSLLRWRKSQATMIKAVLFSYSTGHLNEIGFIQISIKKTKKQQLGLNVFCQWKILYLQ